MKSWLKAVVAAACLCAGAPAMAQEQYPTRPVKIIVPFSPGGTVDVVARVVAQRLSVQMGQQFVVENRPGASGMIGSEAVARSAADGYTLLVQSPTLIANPLIQKTSYDSVRDFTPVTLIGASPMLVASHPSVPARNLKEFLAAAKAKPKAFTFGTSAIGSPMHFAEEAIKRQAGVDILVVPYKGTANALNDVLGGQISAIIDAIPSSYPHVQGKKLTALAVTSKERIPMMPDVPTVAESGVPGFEMLTWYGLWAPAKLPPAIAQKLAAEVAKAVKTPAVADTLGKQGFVQAAGTPEEFTAFLAKERETYAKIAKEANIRVD